MIMILYVYLLAEITMVFSEIEEIGLQHLFREWLAKDVTYSRLYSVFDRKN